LLRESKLLVGGGVTVDRFIVDEPLGGGLLTSGRIVVQGVTCELALAGAADPPTMEDVPE
jgi:hypothetical protein